MHHSLQLILSYHQILPNQSFSSLRSLLPQQDIMVQSLLNITQEYLRDHDPHRKSRE
jgi:hypothetical protein